MAEEIVSLAVLEALPGKNRELLSTLRDLEALMRRKGYSRDELHRDKSRSGRFLLLRRWISAQTRADAQDDPEVQRCWRRLSEVCTVPVVYEKLERISKHQ
jgi:quinol monooxygenase YgiN